MAKIFISYRRSDTAPYAGRLYDRLTAEFTDAQVFMDLEIKPGEDFIRSLEEGVQESDVFLVLIGPSWLDARDRQGRRRLDDPEDFARIELAAALDRQIRVIPVLVGGATMPAAGELPEHLASLARRQAIELSDSGFRADAERLIDLIAEEAGIPRTGPRGAAAGPPVAEETLEPPAGPTPAAGRRALRYALPLAVLAVAGLAAVLLLGGGSNDGAGGAEDATGSTEVTISGSVDKPAMEPNRLTLAAGSTFSVTNSLDETVKVADSAAGLVADYNVRRAGFDYRGLDCDSITGSDLCYETPVKPGETVEMEVLPDVRFDFQVEPRTPQCRDNESCLGGEGPEDLTVVIE